MDSTDRAISRILEQHVPQNVTAGTAPEESKKENEQKMVNINFKVERRNSLGGANAQLSTP